MSITGTLKKHKKAIMIGGGIAVALYLMKSRSSAPKQMPIGPTVGELKAVTGSLGSLE